MPYGTFQVLFFHYVLHSLMEILARVLTNYVQVDLLLISIDENKLLDACGFQRP